MKKFKVLLSRNYIVTIEAENEENAKIYSKYFISGVYAFLLMKKRKNHKFRINEIEMTINDAFEVKEIEYE